MNHSITQGTIWTSLRASLRIVRSALLAKRQQYRLKQSLVLLVALLMLLALSTPSIPTVRATTTQLDADWGKMPLTFIANQGQMDSRVAYYVQGSDKTLYFTPEGVTFALNNLPPGEKFPSSRFRERSQQWIVKLDFLEANAVLPKGQEQTQTVISYFKGSPQEWRTELPTYSRIVYPGLWEGVDLVYSGTTNRLKYEFVVQPGADPSRIRLSYRGAIVSVNQAGQLEVSTPAGAFYDDAPIAYQEVEGQHLPVEVSFALDQASPSSAEQPQPFGFHLGDYDRSLPLVVDPAVLIYCGFIGGSSDDGGSGIAVDSAGNAYVTGGTQSTAETFPETVGPETTYGGSMDAFVAKVKADGTGLVYAGYIGGDNPDIGYSIAVDDADNAYVTGWTMSTETTFPVLVGPDLSHNGGQDAFVAKVNPDGTGLVYAGYIGGGGYDWGNGIVVDPTGNAYIAGETDSTEATFPEIVGPDLAYNGNDDAFVAKVNADGMSLAYAGYIGGDAAEYGNAIAIDILGNAYVTGYTSSTESSFPVNVGPDLTHNGGTDAFVAKVNATGAWLVYAGYIGGASDDKGYGIAMNTSGNAYITGETYSGGVGFPEILKPILSPNAACDSFVAEVYSSGGALVYLSHIGGSADDTGYGIAVDSSGSPYITGRTYSLSGPSSSSDAFVYKLDATGSTLEYWIFIGGSGDDAGYDIALDAAGNAYITGETQSTESTFPETVGPDLAHNGGRDAFVALVSTISLYLPIVLR